jgi:hypothetical protein
MAGRKEKKEIGVLLDNDENASAMWSPSPEILLLGQIPVRRRLVSSLR